MGKLDGKVAIITGGTKGIGLATAKLFVKEGACVIACSRNKNNFNVEGAEYYSLDVSNNLSCKKMTEYVVKKYGQIDILVNNAGIMIDKTLSKLSPKDFDAVISTNLKGCFNMGQATISYMKNKKYGSIINISSVVASQGNYGQTCYVASKAGIEGMTKVWAREAASHGENIRINCVAPGPVLTDIFSNTPQQFLDSLKNKSILKRLGTPEEIANVILFLSSDDSSCITGAIIHADCGSMM